MSDELAFLAAVRDRPNDALTRLVFADWLDERDTDETRTKARFLRVWCDLADTPLTDLEGYTTRADELEALRPRLDPDWLAAVDGARFHVAAPDAARLRAEAFLLRHGRTEARVGEVTANGADFLVRYADMADGFAPGDKFVLPFEGRLKVDRATGRVHDPDARFRPPPTPAAVVPTATAPAADLPATAKPPTLLIVPQNNYDVYLRRRREFLTYVQTYSLFGVFATTAGFCLAAFALAPEFAVPLMSVLFVEGFVCLLVFLVAFVCDR